MQPMKLVIGIGAVLLADFILIAVQAAKVLIETLVVVFLFQSSDPFSQIVSGLSAHRR